MARFLQGVLALMAVITLISVFWPDGMIPRRAFTCVETDSKGCISWVRKDRVEVTITRKAA